MYRQTLTLPALAASLLLLAACGGGGGGGGTAVKMMDDEAMAPAPESQPEAQPEPESTPDPTPEPAPAPTPEPMPEPEAAPEPVSIPDTLSDLIRSSTTVIDASTINADIWSTTVQRTPASLSLADITRSTNFAAVEQRRGVSVVATPTGTSFDYGGWMEHSFFLTSVWNPVSRDPLDPRESVFADVYSIGNASGSNPVSGRATWAGVTVGVDASSRSTAGNVIKGDAAVTVDFANTSVDVALTNLTDTATRASHGDMRWNNLSLRNGAFDHNGGLSVGVAFADRGSEFNSLTGQFYGPNHEEVGGVFIRDEIAGAFGATRDQ